MFHFKLSQKEKVVISAVLILILSMIFCYLLFFRSLSTFKIIFYTLNILFVGIMFLAILTQITTTNKSHTIKIESSLLLAKNFEYELFGNIYEFWLYKNKELILYKYNLSSFIVIEEELYVDQYASIEIKSDQYIIKFLDKIIELKAHSN